MATINKRYGEQYIATASPSTGYRFVKWTGTGVDTTANPATLTCLGDNTIEAIFERLQYTLTVGVSPANSGNIFFDEDIFDGDIKYKATANLSSANNWLSNNTDQNRNTWNSTTGIGHLYLNAGVTDFTRMFNNLSALQEVNFAKLDKNAIDNSNGICSYCRNLTKVRLPYMCQVVPYGGFAYCTSLVEVTNTEYVYWLKTNAFAYCSALQQIDLPTAMKLQDYCFERAGLTSINLPSLQETSRGDGDTDTTVGCFYNCTALQRVEIGSHLPSIAIGVFSECTSLSTVICHTTYHVPLLLSDNFTANNNDTLYVEPSMVSAYQADSAWSSAFTTITAIQ